MSHSCSVKSRFLPRLQSRSALTLLELVVVLGILAIMSTMAVRSLEPLADQARYEATQQLLSQLRESICSNCSPNPSDTISGYIADTGMLPASPTDLLTLPGGLAGHAVQAFDSDRDTINDITLSSGWRGPYFSLGPGANAVLDGWGRTPAFVPVGSGLTIVSTGSDNDSVSPEDGYRADVSLPILARDFAGDIECRLFDIDSLSGLRIDPSPTGTQQLGVLFYGVNAAGGTTGAIEEQLLIVAASGSFEVRRNDTTSGAVAMRAILWNDLDSDDVLDSGESILKKSYVHHVQVRPAVDTRVEMELR